MGISRVINRRTAVLGLLLVILATAGFGFAASNTVAPSAAGDGDEAISGYNITNIHYTLDTSNPGLLAQVSFDLAPLLTTVTELPADVMVQLVQTTGAWYDCETTDSGFTANYTCDIDTNLLVESANNFRVIAHD